MTPTSSVWVAASANGLPAASIETRTEFAADTRWRIPSADAAAPPESGGDAESGASGEGSGAKRGAVAPAAGEAASATVMAASAATTPDGW